MPLVLRDRVRETSTTTGTGTFTLAGAVAGFQAFSVIGNGNTVYYAIAGQTTSEWEVGLGTYTTTGNTLARTTVLASSNAGSAVNFSAGTKDVFATYPASVAVTLADVQTLTNKTLTAPRETITVSATAATGTINFDAVTQAVLYFTTNASGNFTVNFRGNASTTLNTLMAVGESLTVAFLVTNGATPFNNTAVTIDGSAVTPRWQGGTAPAAGNANSIDVYSYTIIKTGNATFTVLASQTKFA